MLEVGRAVQQQSSWEALETSFEYTKEHRPRGTESEDCSPKKMGMNIELRALFSQKIKLYLKRVYQFHKFIQI